MSAAINGQVYQHAQIVIGGVSFGDMRAINYGPRNDLSGAAALPSLVQTISFLLPRGLVVAIYDALGHPPTTRYWRRRLVVRRAREQRRREREMRAS